MKTYVATVANQCRNLVKRGKGIKSDGDSPTCLCPKCGKPMEMELGFSITGAMQQNWSCSECSVYRIINPYYTDTRMIFRNTDNTGNSSSLYIFAPSLEASVSLN